jgi:uncharacterized protein (DUF1697 family)
VALVVFLRGANVGGHRVFRPAALAKELSHLGAVNVGAAGTFVIREPIARKELRTELSRRLPFETRILICHGREIARLMSLDIFGSTPAPSGIVRFVSLLVAPPRNTPRLPVRFPSRGQWLLEIVARDKRFVFGQYRRHIKTIRYLGMLDRVFGVPVTTRNWNTMMAIATALHRHDSSQ